MLPDWHAMRRAGLSSSDLTAMLGKSEHRSPRQLQAEKLGRDAGSPRLEPTEDMWWGNIMEPYVVARAADKLKAELLPPESWDEHLGGDVVACRDGDARKWMVLNAHWPIARSTPDNFAWVDSELVVFECKTTGQAHKWRNGPPRSVWFQCQWHMLCAGTNVRKAIVPVLFFERSRRLAFYTIDLHPSFDGPECKAIKLARKWWEAHVERGEPVPPMRVDIRDIDRQFTKTDGSTVDLAATFASIDDDYTERLKARDELKTKLDRATANLRDVEAQVRDAMGKAMFARVEGRPGVEYRLFTDRHGKRRLKRKEKA